MIDTREITLGLFGGTFDPVHVGHLQSADFAFAHLHLDQLFFIPNAIPAHRAQPQAHAQHRLALLQLAIKDKAQYAVDTLELERAGPSYSIDTLMAYRQRYPNACLIFLIGFDAFLGLTTWHRWQELLQFSHFAVMARDCEQNEFPAEIQNLLLDSQVNSVDHLKKSPSGKIFFLKQPHFDGSSSTVRAKLHAKQSVKTLLPAAVADYIQKQGLYR